MLGGDKVGSQEGKEGLNRRGYEAGIKGYGYMEVLPSHHSR